MVRKKPLIPADDKAVAPYPSGAPDEEETILKQERNNISVETSLDYRIEDIAAQKIALERLLQDRFQEIAALTRIVRERDVRIMRADRQLEWFRRVLSLVTKGFSTSRKAGIMAWLPYYFTRRKIRYSLKSEKLFDPDAYISLYPDVSGDDIDPFRHYILHGIQEGRRISKDTDHG